MVIIVVKKSRVNRNTLRITKSRGQNADSGLRDYCFCNVFLSGYGRWGGGG